MDGLQDDQQYRFPEGATGESLLSIIAHNLVLKAEQPVETRVTFYDTFDWRLFGKGMVLSRTGDEWVVRRLPTGTPLDRVITGSLPRFACEIEDGPLKQRIESIVGVRRLLCMGEATIHRTPYRVLNTDEKTVARLLDTHVRAGSGSAATLLDAYVTLQPLRGYAGQARRLARILEEAGLADYRWQETFERILAAAGKRPGDYSAKPDYDLQPGMRADAATKTILRRTLTVLQANEEGVKADWDVEFLHDYRTAVRRTRSVLSEIPDVFPQDIAQRYKAAFALLGKQTNRLRDLDVYLLSEADYRDMFPDAMRDHISPLFDYLRPQRVQALRDVIGYLESQPYATMMEAWAAFVREPVADDRAAPNAAIPIDDLARRRIAKRYRRVIKDGNKILDSDADELVHQLRIDCKKLRYLMEFFDSLFPAKKVNRLIGQLKILQDELGAFNDLSVQQAYLTQIAEVLPAGDAQGKRGLVAIGFLIEKLASEQQAMKPGIAKVFADFAAAPNRAVFGQLLSAKEGASES